MLLLRKTFGPFVRPPIKATTRYMFVVYGFTSHSRALREKFYHLFNFFFVQSCGRRGRTDVLSGLRKASLVTIEGQWMRSAFAHTKPFGGCWRWGWWQIRWNIRRWGQTIWPPWPRSPIFHSGTAHHIVLHNVACDSTDCDLRSHITDLPPLLTLATTESCSLCLIGLQWLKPISEFPKLKKKKSSKRVIFYFS